MERQIIGIVLARNEEWTIRWAVECVLEFCDHIYLFDHGSTDRTPEIFRELAEAHDHLTFQSISEARESHVCLEPYAGNPIWVFGVDGDEIYDPAVLSRLRPRLLSGEFDDYFKLTANCLHVDSLAIEEGTVSGFTCPPAKAVTKLYNFNAISRWDQVPNERLHGGNVEFKDGYTDETRMHFWQQHCWEETPMRCLHLCFHPRSSVDRPGLQSRRNISDRVAHGSKKTPVLNKIKSLIMENTLVEQSAWKEDQYRRGDRVTVSLAPFVSDSARPFMDRCQVGR